MSAEGEGIIGNRTDDISERRRLLGVWLAAGSAVAAMVGLSWNVVAGGGGGVYPSGDMIGHAATAEWLRTLPWWDWRGWSDWFYGGQAVGVNYPPLPHAWLRFTHPVHSQMVAIALGLLVLLPLGALRLARAVGYAPPAQRVAVAGALVLPAVGGDIHRVLAGFNYSSTFFSSWPAMLAAACGLFCAAWSAECRRPAVCGAVAGIAVLCNATVIPGLAVVCLTLLVTSGCSFRTGVRWAATAGSAALAVAGWWLVPFVAGWERLVRWEISFSDAWNFGGVWQTVLLAGLVVGVTWVARTGSVASRRLATAAGVGLLAAVVCDLFGYLRADRWLAVPILVAVVTLGGLARSRDASPVTRPSVVLLVVACLTAVVVVAGAFPMLPLAAWLLLWPRRVWAAAGALAWSGVLIWVPFWLVVPGASVDDPPREPLEAEALSGMPGATGLVHANGLYNNAAGVASDCAGGDPWDIAIKSNGGVRALFGVYKETNHASEFLASAHHLRVGNFRAQGGFRPDWFEAWEGLGEPSLEARGGAEALGARWFVECDADGELVVTELPGVLVSGVSVVPFAEDEVWHRAAVEWWLPIAAGLESAGAGGLSVVPVVSDSQSEGYPLDQPAGGVVLDAAGDVLTVRAERAGWAWLRVPWDPDWRSVSGTPVRKGGPGHLVVWAQEGETVLRWSVQRSVDVAAAGVTGASLLLVAGLAVLNRRRGWEFDSDRRKPASEALAIFADTVDRWAYTAATRTRELAQHTKQRLVDSDR